MEDQDRTIGEDEVEAHASVREASVREAAEAEAASTERAPEEERGDDFDLHASQTE